LDNLGRLLSIQLGMPQKRSMPPGVRVDSRDPTWTSGIFKKAVAGVVQVAATGIDGDGQADLENHGGPDNVLLAYDGGLYPMWRETLQRSDLAHGAFGENFTVQGFSDSTVCIGDTWQVGGAGGLVLQVTQARQPCFKLARRLETPQIVKLVREQTNGGWYLRVLHDGPAQAGMPIARIGRVHGDWPVSRAVEVMYTRAANAEAARQLAALPELSTRWKQELLE